MFVTLSLCEDVQTLSLWSEIHSSNRPQSFVWLNQNKDEYGCLARWSLQLQEFDFEVIHRAGSKHNNADSMTREPIANPESVFVLPDLKGVVNQRSDNQISERGSILQRYYHLPEG